jgi:hypothetical protein
MPIQNQDLTNAPLASPVLISMRTGGVIEYEYKIQNLTGEELIDLQGSFSQGVTLREGDIVPGSLENNDRLLLRLDINTAGIAAGQTKDFEVILRDFDSGEQAALIIRITNNKPKVGGRTARKRANR